MFSSKLEVKNFNLRALHSNKRIIQNVSIDWFIDYRRWRQKESYIRKDKIHMTYLVKKNNYILFYRYYTRIVLSLQWWYYLMNHKIKYIYKFFFYKYCITSHHKNRLYILANTEYFFNHQTGIMWINTFSMNDLQSLPKKAGNWTVVQCCKVDTAIRM